MSLTHTHTPRGNKAPLGFLIHPSTCKMCFYFIKCYQNFPSFPHSMLKYTFKGKNIINRFVCIKIERCTSIKQHEPVHLI